MEDDGALRHPTRALVKARLCGGDDLGRRDLDGKMPAHRPNIERIRQRAMRAKTKIAAESRDSEPIKNGPDGAIGAKQKRVPASGAGTLSRYKLCVFAAIPQVEGVAPPDRDGCGRIAKAA